MHMQSLDQEAAIFRSSYTEISGKDLSIWKAVEYGSYGNLVSFLEGTSEASSCDVNMSDGKGCTLLYHAVLNGHRNLVLCLLHRGASVNLADKCGALPLHVACAKGYTAIVSLLIIKDPYLHQSSLKKRAESDQKLWNGLKTPTEILKEKNFFEIIEMFCML
eukprot:TRINITY_DN8306_c0_g2_i13.p2 TRINITY_DN8306_c0_g2~~TRINITY_DN8306_c0_g2_i13.p2  ORF type:complete len:162 (+),score=31.38 TRINITY_DN8306_c0_g2_i13:685-1170(+)